MQSKGHESALCADQQQNLETAPDLRGFTQPPTVVESVKKTDGKEMEMMGVKLYEMAVDVTAKYPKGYVCQSVLLSAMNNFCSFMSKESIPQGTSITKSMKIVFTKSEKGWRGKFR